MLLAPSFLAISLVRMVDALIVMDAAATTTSACCPTCGTRSTEIHDRYQRHPADLPWRGYRVQLALLVRRFRCLNPACSRATFAEGLGSALRPYARRTADAEALLLLMAHTSGAEAGARLAAQAGLPASADTLLRLLRRGATVATAPPARRPARPTSQHALALSAPA